MATAFPFPDPIPDDSSVIVQSVTQEEFHAFHAIDRQLFTHLVVTLGCDPDHSMKIMALWLWLERHAQDLYLVSRLLKLPDTILYYLMDEASAVMQVVAKDEFAFPNENVRCSEIPLMQTLVSKLEDVTLRYFFNRHVEVIRGSTQIMNEICVRAFYDIYQHVVESRNPSLFQVSPNQSVMLGNVPLDLAGLANVPRPVIQIPFDRSVDPRFYIVATLPPPPSRELLANRMALDAEMEELLDQINCMCSGGASSSSGGSGLTVTTEVPPDDRTIFLTFSKGYPISEIEVREFFKRRNGDVIDEIFMQEVPLGEQTLYARMVVKTEALVDKILGGKDAKAKFAINGKHVWGRKYVKKATGASGASPSSSGGGH